ncbi:hypothetical protein [uncultured Cohaesibacter sp.]|uniref:hypothetical protein n=1 Tax=uncultured Cohaesibacter sp. TaxID=1002546 RepID=UPI00293164D2|nr:hypothetical protein [uncultured Cohaesibacter sp.]
MNAITASGHQKCPLLAVDPNLKRNDLDRLARGSRFLQIHISVSAVDYAAPRRAALRLSDRYGEADFFRLGSLATGRNWLADPVGSQNCRFELVCSNARSHSKDTSRNRRGDSALFVFRRYNVVFPRMAAAFLRIFTTKTIQVDLSDFVEN